jgi:hypothetical protein
VDCADKAVEMATWFAGYAQTFGDADYLAKEVDAAAEADSCDTVFYAHWDATNLAFRDL